jgi:YfiH family protein
MIRAPGVPGVAFGNARDGDARSDLTARRAISRALGIPEAWATVDQVHGSAIAVVSTPGNHGEADGLFTTQSQLPLTVATADCVPVAIVADGAAAIVHAGWRGVASGVVAEALNVFATSDTEPRVAVIGPHIGACCYEVGDEVIDSVGGFVSTTTWGSQSVGLGDAIEAQLGDVRVLKVGGCTMEGAEFASHRENGTTSRQVAVVWNP